ncbi:MAG: glycosyltransferase family 1 protein [Frankiaceae bacterium]|nr:glycosyltransferase family 1 protein [Arenimonas sp.]
MELNLFYAEPDNDRWLPYDRFPRRAVRRLLRGKPRPGGQTRVFLNLMAGLDEIGTVYRVNDYRHARRNPHELACIIGKPFVLDEMEWQNPILFGASVFSHPIDDPQLFERRPVRKVLVPGPWMAAMCEPYWGSRVQAWPVGIDTAQWRPLAHIEKSTDVLLYNKVLWDKPEQERDLVEPIRARLALAGLSFVELRYGHYQEADFLAALHHCRAMVFLCDHETQGIAYQQALACDVPILAWDRGGPWRDPSYYPDRVVFGPVSSVPYWDARCGRRFASIGAFPALLSDFMCDVAAQRYQPRQYILDHLTLAKCAREYVEIARAVQEDALSGTA